MVIYSNNADEVRSCRADTFHLVQKICEGKSTCYLDKSMLYNQGMKDPCDGVWKYLEVKYVCLKGKCFNNLLHKLINSSLHY